MLKHAFLSVLAVSLLAMLLGIYFSSTMDKSQDIGFPWQVDKKPDGSISVFKIHLGKTTLGEAELLLNETAELSMFKPKDESAVIEAYFDKVLIGGLSSKIIVTFSIEPSKILSMYDRGVRISTLGSGTRRITLSSEDQTTMRNEKIHALTYLPSINLSEDLIEKRFGEPDRKISEQENEITHWLYSEIGVDVALHINSKEVIVYVMPENFSKILAPLESSL